MLPEKLEKKLLQRIEQNTLRVLGEQKKMVDFSSNDYLGFAKSETIFKATHQHLLEQKLTYNGATGSRLLSGNHKLYQKLESTLSKFHNSPEALVFNSGYDANLGFFSCVPQRGDIILYDELIHASIRDGIQLSHAKAYKFDHNNLQHLEEMLQKFLQNDTIYIVTESVFSMDGDSPDLVKLSKICKKHHAKLIVDEAHAVGVLGKNGCGKMQELNIENEAFARIITFGKALGCHGAAILGIQQLKDYLINFSRPFIYTTGLPPHSLTTIDLAYNQLIDSGEVQKSSINILNQNIKYFKSELNRLNLNEFFINSDSAIHSCILSGNKNVKHVAKQLEEKGFEVKPILSPTVPKGKERLRFCLHAYNSKEEITKVLQLLATFVSV